MPTKPSNHRPRLSGITKRPQWVDYDQQRGTSSDRGYGARWRKYALQFRRENPVCMVPKCVNPSTDVDHKRRVSGPDDPCFWDPENHQALCHSCHSAKTAHEGRRSTTYATDRGGFKSHQVGEAR